MRELADFYLQQDEKSSEPLMDQWL